MESFIYLSKSAAILGLFYFVYIAVLRKDTFFTANRHYLLSGILAALVLPLLEFTKTIYIASPVSIPSSLSESIASVQAAPTTYSTDLNWWYVALGVYGLGVSIMLLRFLRQLFSLFTLLKQYPSEKTEGYTYIKVPKKCAPFSFFRYIVYNPTMHSQEELGMILKHEQIHGSQWHSVDIILANLLAIFQWINPLAWFYKKGIEENLEFIADSATVEELESVKQYQLALVKASSTLPIPALTTNFYQSFIKKRILMLNKSTSNKINVWKLCIVLPLLAIFLWSFNVNEVVSYTENTGDMNDSSIASEKITEEIETPKAVVKMDNTTLTTSEEKKESEANLSVIPSVSNLTSDLSEEKNSTKKLPMEAQEVIVTISKDTTEEELKAMKLELENKGFTFNYSNLKYNSANEIIGISLKYKDANGNSGNYSVNSDEAINTIIIKTDGNRISMSNSGGNYGYSFDTDEEIERHRADRTKEMEMRKKEMEIRREEMGERQIEMKVRREEMREQMMEERFKKREEMKNRKDTMTEDRDVIIIEKDGTSEQLLDDGDEDGLFVRKEINEDSDGAVHVNKMIKRKKMDKYHKSLFGDDLKQITKDASESDLEKIKQEFDAEGVSFSYSSLKRNSAGEITKIKVKLNNNNGSVSTSTYDNDGEAIKTIYIGVNEGTTIMTSRPQ